MIIMLKNLKSKEEFVAEELKKREADIREHQELIIDFLQKFVRLRKTSKFRKKIEELLANCNYRGESGLLSEDLYDECIKLISEIGKVVAV